MDAGDLIVTDWKIFLPQSYRIGFHHFWADYNAWSGHYFIENLSNPDDKSLFIDNTGALCLSCNSAKAKRAGIGPQDARLVYTDKDGNVYAYKQKLEWKLIMSEATRLQFLGRPSNVVSIQDLNGSRSFNVSYYNWHYRSIWSHMIPELTKKSLNDEVLGVVFELKEVDNVVGTAYYKPNFNDRLKFMIEMEDPNFGYREFALVYACAMNHAHPYGIRTDKTNRLFIH